MTDAPDPMRAAAAEPPADLVETVAHVIRWGDFTPLASAILAALAGRLIQPGMVAVPAEDLRLAISSVQTVPRLNALLRLREIANGR